MIRLVVSLLFSYKALEGKWSRPTLETIRNVPFNGDLTKYSVEYRKFWLWLLESLAQNRPEWDARKVYKYIYDVSFNTSRSPFTVKAGANYRVAPLSAVLDLIAWEQQPHNRLLEFMNLAGQGLLLGLYQRVLNRLSTFSGCLEWLVGCFRSKNTLSDLKLGKLSLKFEAAGKVRVFAIVDFWTHLVLHPVHSWMFNLLRALPTDGTFDQNAAIKSFVEEYGKTPCFSFDLSAATDNIPVRLTTQILSIP